MEPIRVLIGALSGWQYPDRRQRCRSTWIPSARRHGLDAVLLVGVPEIKAPERDEDFLFLQCPNDYGTLPQRTREFVKWALDRDDWQYLFKCDDDTYVATERLAGYDFAGRDYIGAEWQEGVDYGSGGAGYLLSRRAAAIVAQELGAQTGAEDLLVGRLLRKAGILLHVDPRFVPFGSETRRPRPDNDLITVHGIPAELFLKSHAELNP